MDAKNELIEMLKLHSKTEVAKRLGVSRKTLYQYIEKLGIRDQIPRYSKQSYVSYLESKINELKSNNS